MYCCTIGFSTSDGTISSCQKLETATFIFETLRCMQSCHVIFLGPANLEATLASQIWIHPSRFHMLSCLNKSATFSFCYGAIIQPARRWPPSHTFRRTSSRRSRTSTASSCLYDRSLDHRSVVEDLQPFVRTLLIVQSSNLHSTAGERGLSFFVILFLTAIPIQ